MYLGNCFLQILHYTYKNRLSCYRFLDLNMCHHQDSSILMKIKWFKNVNFDVRFITDSLEQSEPCLPISQEQSPVLASH